MPRDQTESIHFHGTQCISSVFSGERLLVYLKPRSEFICQRLVNDKKVIKYNGKNTSTLV